MTSSNWIYDVIKLNLCCHQNSFPVVIFNSTADMFECVPSLIGSVVIAAITSCTNTSNPSVMLGAGLLAKKAVELGLTTKPYIKTSLSPGSGVVTYYLEESGVKHYLEKLGWVSGFLVQVLVITELTKSFCAQTMVNRARCHNCGFNGPSIHAYIVIIGLQSPAYNSVRKLSHQYPLFCPFLLLFMVIKRHCVTGPY